MLPTSPLFSGMPNGRKFIGWWGAMGGEKQRGLTTYSLSSNQQAPMRGALQGYLVYGFKRIASQAPYFAPPFIIAYAYWQYLLKEAKYLNSKEGHHATHLAELAEEEAKKKKAGKA